MAASMHEDSAEHDDVTGTPGGGPVPPGIEQFQRAALEAIRAGRVMLDAAESILQDPSTAESLVRSVGNVARTATEAVSGFAAGRWPQPSQSSDDPAPTGGEPDPPDGFERITVD
jgi:hypothetical protein